GIAPTFRWGIGLADEFSAGLFHLETDGRPIYNHPWFVIDGRLRTTVPARNYYGLASDYLRTESTYGTLSHIHRFDAKTELKTTLRHGRFERDLWVSAIGFAPAAFQPGGVAATIDTLSDATVLQRNPKGRRAESDLTQLQSELTADFDALGRRHSVIAGVDFYFEDAKRANNYAGAASGIRTTLDTPNDGATREDPRAAPVFNTFDADNAAIFVQDTITIAPRWKAVAGLRLDRFKASYVTAGTTAANGTVTPSTVFSTSENLWSPRAGLLFQPDEATTWYVSYGTSYNTSGDTYQYTPGNPNLRDANTPPEKSRNVEAGAKFDLANGAASVAVAAFRSEKYNERNTDPDSAAQQNLLSGKRHATGMELSVAGRLTPRWEIFYNHTWIPSARIDRSNVALNAAGTGAQVEGDRPGLTPKHSASLWSTYRLNHAIRLGLGVNHRGEQNPEGARHVTAPAFTTVDAMAEYSLGEDTTVKLSGTNLGDKRYADALYRGFYAPGAPRAVQVTLRTTF
ncbi:MAG TPA: TonB-dependent receptor, partial [Usitatibacteraceae bacterium]|nr:TonB-dependent receptor [Usitatibacteraceae bacterium]